MKNLPKILILSLCLFGNAVFGMQLQLTYQNPNFGKELTSQDIEALERTIGYTFNDKSFLRQALTTQQKSKSCNYEQLEFVGDAILEAIIAQLLSQQFPHSTPGQLTGARHALVSEEPMAALGLYLGIDQYIQHSKSEFKIHCLCDMVEALIAAIQKDGGPEAAQNFVLKYFIPMMDGKECPGMANQKIAEAAKKYKKNLCYNVVQGKVVIHESVGIGTISEKEQSDEISRSQYRLSKYIADREFLLQFSEYKNKLVRLAIDQDYKPLTVVPICLPMIPKSQTPAAVAVIEPKQEALSKSFVRKPEKKSASTIFHAEEVTSFSLAWNDSIKKNFRERLNELISRLGYPKLRYECVQLNASNESPRFVCTLQQLLSFGVCKGTGTSKVEAEEEAARNAYIQLQKRYGMSAQVAEINGAPALATPDPVSTLNQFCQAQRLDIPTYEQYFKEQDGRLGIYSIIKAAWLWLGIKGPTMVETSPAKAEAAKRVMGLMDRLTRGFIEINKLDFLIRAQSIIKGSSSVQAIQQLTLVAKDLGYEVALESHICEGPVADGKKYKATITFTKDGHRVHQVKGIKHTVKTDAEKDAATKALEFVTKKLLKQIAS